MIIAPSILSFDLAFLADSVPKLEFVGADVLHLDVMDGQFVPPISFGDSMARALRSVATIPFEAHLMTLTPEAQFQAFREAGCARIIFHEEATVHSFRLIQRLHEMEMMAGIAVNPGTSIEAVQPVVDEVDLVLVMTVNPGWGGQEFIDSMLSKVKWLRSRRPSLAIEVDGGVDPTTIRSAFDAGADHFVVGSFLAHSNDLARSMEQLRHACA